MNGDSILLVEDDKEIRQGVKFPAQPGIPGIQAENALKA